VGGKEMKMAEEREIRILREALSTGHWNREALAIPVISGCIISRAAGELLAQVVRKGEAEVIELESHGGTPTMEGEKGGLPGGRMYGVHWERVWFLVGGDFDSNLQDVPSILEDWAEVRISGDHKLEMEKGLVYYFLKREATLDMVWQAREELRKRSGSISKAKALLEQVSEMLA
jgi:hypothetical protein